MRIRASHAARGPLSRRTVVAGIGAAAATIAIVVGVAMLIRPAPAEVATQGPTAELITREAVEFPLPEPVLREMLGEPPEFGPLSDPGRRTACLSALGYGGTARVLGARPLPDGVVMLLPGDVPGSVRGVAVGTSCSALDPHVLGRTTLAAPATPDHP